MSETKPQSEIEKAEKELAPREVRQLSEEELRKLSDISKEIDLTQADEINQYGAGVQKNVSKFTDGVLKQIRAKDAGEIGQLLTDLVVGVRSVDVGRLGKAPGFLSRIFSGFMTEAKRFLHQFDKVEKQVSQISSKLELEKQGLDQDSRLLDELFRHNLEYFHALQLYILAGEQKLEEVRQTLLPELEAKAQSGAVEDLQNAKDLRSAMGLFERRLHDLKLTRTLTLQTLPQIRMVQGSNYDLSAKIQSSILNTIPLWKNQITLAITLYRQKAALKTQRDVTDATNEIIRKNSELLKDNTIEVAKESERGIVDIETLKKANQDFISTIEETLAIQAEGRRHRVAVEQELLALEDSVKATLQKTSGARA